MSDPTIVRVGVDFETFWAQDYTLRTMPAPLYVRDKRFRAWGAAVKINDARAAWVPAEKLQQVFARIPWSRAILYGHNLPFDGFILSDRYGVRPMLYVCTLSMARAVLGGAVKSRTLHALGEHYGLGGKLDDGRANDDMRGVTDPTAAQLESLARYACHDIELTRQVYAHLAPHFPTNEYPVVDWTIRMMTEPRLELDSRLLLQAWAEEVERKKDLVASVGLTKTQLNSNKQFADILRAHNIDPPMKISKTTGKLTYAFSKQDEEFVELQESENETVAALVEARLGTKSSIEETRLRRFWELAQTPGLMPIPLNYSGAMTTHRLSGAQGFNLQNLGRKSPLRKGIRAPKGKVLVVSDSANIELRVSCGIAGQHNVLRTLAAGGDEYSSFASHLFGVPVSKALAKENPKIGEYRQVGKIAILSLGYQSGPGTFQKMVWVETTKQGATIKLSSDEAERIVRAYRSRYSAIRRCWADCSARLSMMMDGYIPTNLPTDPPLYWEHDHIVLPSGLALKYPELQMRTFVDPEDPTAVERTQVYRNWAKSDMPEGFKRIYGGLLLENLSQALAREIIVYQTMRIRERYPVVMQVHDEVVVVAPEAEADEALNYVQSCMRAPVPFWPDLPLDCEAKVGTVYGEIK